MEIEQIVFEVRYHFGTLYLDRCGRIIRELALNNHEWIFKDATPQTGTLISSSNGTILNFNTAKVDLSIQRTKENEGLTNINISSFVAQVGSTVPTILDKLDIEPEMVARYGCRVIISFPMDSEKHSGEWILSRGLFEVEGFKTFENGEFRSASSVVVIEGETATYRVSISSAERSSELDVGQRRVEIKPRNLPRGQREALIKQLKSRTDDSASECAVLFDVDAFCDDPRNLDPAQFVESNTNKVIEFASSLARGRSKK